MQYREPLFYKFEPLDKFYRLVRSRKLNIVDKLKDFCKDESHSSNIGLYMTDGFKVKICEYSPSNVITFAKEEHEDVYFSLFENQDVDSSPVIMTVAKYRGFGVNNMVIANNLSDFLRLGCRAGYFFTGNLAYDFDYAISEIKRANRLPPSNTGLAELNEYFELKPLRGPARYILNTNDKYINNLKFLDS